MNAGTISTTDLLLDLLNSTPVVSGVPIDELADATSARTWCRDRGFELPAVERSGFLELRHILQGVVRGTLSFDELAPFFEGVTKVPHVVDGSVRWELASTEIPVIEVDLVLELSELFETMPGRLKPCGNDECRLFLLDRTRAGTGRWCSMTTCGNRMKARRHAARTSGR